MGTDPDSLAVHRVKATRRQHLGRGSLRDDRSPVEENETIRVPNHVLIERTVVIEDEAGGASAG